MKTLSSFTKFSFAAVGCGLLFTACGDDVTKVYRAEGSGMEIAVSADSLGECDSTNLRRTVFVTDENVAYVCSESGWATLAPETEVVKCAVKQLSDKSGYKIMCGGDSVGVVRNGTNGTNGTDGTDGKNGTNGKNGAAGKDGSDGTSCTVKAAENGFDVLCGGEKVGELLNGAAGDDGENGESCSATKLDDGSGVVIKCADELDTLVNGKNGEKGETGEAGTSCTVTAADNGFDVYCGETKVGSLLNGKDGEDGAKGDDGEDGTSCTVKALDDGTGYDIVCGEATVGTIKNGAKGDSGAQGVKGADGKSCTVEALTDGSGYNLTCDDKTVTVKNGNDGENGTSCTVANLDDNSGVTITCGEKTVTVKNGEKGETGATGAQGATGPNGTSCTVEAVTDGYNIVCGTETVGTIKNGAKGDSGVKGETGAQGIQGAAGESCTLTDNSDGTITLQCGETSTTLYKSLCGTSAYDPANNFCYDNALYSYCNGASYNPEEQFCHGAALYDLCGGKEYNPDSGFCDTRDGISYKMVTIGTQTWMAENLNHDTTTGSYCDDDYCATYGRLYTATVAAKACPTGWHLPTSDEWATLSTTVGDAAGTALKSTSGWNDDGNGTDAVGFNALPGGQYYYSYSGNGDNAYFWTSTSTTSGRSTYYTYYSLTSTSTGLTGPSSRSSSYYYSVRCLKDAE